MKLIFFRHGIAEDKKPDDSFQDDFLRQLTKEGKKETKKVVKTCKKLLKDIDVIYSSPLSRAVQTAEILHEELDDSQFEILTELDPVHGIDDFINVSTDLKKGTYCFVGHEPHLTTSISALLKSDNKIELEKSGIVILAGDSVKELKLMTVISPKVASKIHR